MGLPFRGRTSTSAGSGVVRGLHEGKGNRSGEVRDGSGAGTGPGEAARNARRDGSCEFSFASPLSWPGLVGGGYPAVNSIAGPSSFRKEHKVKVSPTYSTCRFRWNRRGL